MKHIRNDLRNVSSDYLDRGWLDIDAIMDLMMGQAHKDDSQDGEDELPRSDQANLRRKIIAMAELLELPDIEKKSLLNTANSDQQLEELHRRWAERIGETLGRGDSARENQARERWQDFSVYRSGGI
jgi:hypothetical protein